jgi:hypothetical protein
MILYQYPSKSSSTTGPVEFVLNGVDTKVTQDTSTPANNKPLPSALFISKEGVIRPVADSTTPANVVAVPVKIMAVDGTNINITAGDINIQTTDMGASFDSMRVGDGSGNYIGLTASQEAKTNDSAARASLVTINTSLVDIPNVITTEGGPQTSKGVMIMGHTGGGVARHIKVSGTGVQDVSISSSALPTGAATEAKQDTGNTSLGSIDTKLSSQATAALQGTGNTSLSSIDTKLTSQATAAKQDLLLAELQLKADLTETQPVAPNITRAAGVIDSNTTRVTLASDQPAIPVAPTVATVAGTITNAQIAVGTSAVRCTVAGTAPNAARKRLSIKPSINNSGRIFIGSSGVTTANGLEIVGPDRLDFEFDSGDYYMISDTAAQVVDVLEKV